MHKMIQLISNFLYNKNMPPSMKIHVHWMNLMKNQIIQKFQNLDILKERAPRQKTHFLNHFIKQLCSMGSKYLALDASHMCMK
jgi:VanZ family protein